LQIKSCDNLVDLFTKSLPLATFDKCVKDISMRSLKDLQDSVGDSLLIRIPQFFSLIPRKYITYFTGIKLHNHINYPMGSVINSLKIHKFKLQI
jgi:hypothetical protein